MMAIDNLRLSPLQKIVLVVSYFNGAAGEAVPAKRRTSGMRIWYPLPLRKFYAWWQRVIIKVVFSLIVKLHNFDFTLVPVPGCRPHQAAIVALVQNLEMQFPLTRRS